MLKNSSKNYSTVKAPVGVLGAGVEGRAVINYLLTHGIEDVTALDANDVEGLPSGVKKVFGEKYLTHLDRFATIFKSPGFRPDHREIEKARAAGTKITSTLSYFLENCPCPVVGITGTVGKGTASSLTAEALQASGFTTHLGGNIGRSPLEFLDEIAPNHRVVLEISSFQAMDVSRSPNVTVVLKTTSEHLDWHLSTEEYRAAKANLLAHQKSNDIIIYNSDAPGSVEIAKTGRARKIEFSSENRPIKNGIFIDNQGLFLLEGGKSSLLPLDIKEVSLPGRFNLENVAAGILAALALGGEPETVCKSAVRFASLPHRLEFVCEGNGIRYYNDSYATRPDACIAALDSFDGPLSIILGGSEKNADFGELIEKLHSKTNITHVSLIGATAQRLQRLFSESSVEGFSYHRYETLETAADASKSALKNGGTVLLSPACASFGMFKNYKVRGEQFREIARKLAVLHS